MLEIISNIFSPPNYIPHGHCYLWQSSLVWLHLLSDLLIAVAYYSISIFLIYFVRQKEDVPFKGIFVLFSAFILSCGTTHLMAIWTLWHPAYWLSGAIKAITALISCYTATELIPILPQAISLPSPTALKTINNNLIQEIDERISAEKALKYQLKLNKIITNILSRFIHLNKTELPVKIEEVLQEIGEFTRADRACIVRLDDEQKTFTMTYEWVNHDRKSLKDRLRDIPQTNFSYCTETILRGELLAIDNIIKSEDISAEERQKFLDLEIKSMICVPLTFRKKVVGWIGLLSNSENKIWTQSNIELVQIFSEILTSAVLHRYTQKTLQDYKKIDAKLRHDVFHDSLTGLPNRALLLDRLQQALFRQQRNQNYIFAVLFLDLDGFKMINDTLGHLIGDRLLIAMGNRLGQCLRASDTLARLGGDEFVILLEELKDREDAIAVARRIEGVLKDPFIIEQHEIFVSTSIGITFSFLKSYNEPAQLLEDADKAMYRAKQNGKSSYRIFAPIN